MNVDDELESILTELTRLSQVVADKESMHESIQRVYLEQVGTDSYELHLNAHRFSVGSYELLMLLEQMQEVGLFTKLMRNQG